MSAIIKQHTKVNFTNVNIPVKFIVIHDTGVPGQSAKNNADYFENTYRGASAHYFVDENEIIEVVAPGKKGWHVGDDKDDSDGINNGNTIGIEFCAEKDKTFKPETIANGQLLVQKLMKDYGVSANKVVRHYDASGKNCPQFMNTDGKWTLWKQYHKQLTGATSVTVPLPSNSNKESQHTVKSGDTLWGLSKQYNATVADLKKWNNLKSDIIVVGTKLNLGNNVKTPTPNPTPVASTPKANLKVDGWLGYNTIKELQEYFGTVVDGKLSKPSLVIKSLQKLLGVTADGLMGPNTIKALQKRFGTPQDGKLSEPSMVIKEMQRRLNKGKL